MQEPRPNFIKNRPGYSNSNSNVKPNYSRSNSGDEFVLKVGNIANNVRVRDLKAALLDRGVKPLYVKSKFNLLLFNFICRYINVLIALISDISLGGALEVLHTCVTTILLI